MRNTMRRCKKYDITFTQRIGIWYGKGEVGIAAEIRVHIIDPAPSSLRDVILQLSFWVVHENTQQFYTGIPSAANDANLNHNNLQ